MAVLTNSLTSAAGHLRPLDPRRDLKEVADLVELCFKDSLDSDGQRYLKQMRNSARGAGLLYWASSFADQSTLPLSGYVWEEGGRVVGNLSLIPFNVKGERIYLIANVAVHPNYRRQGIARTLTTMAREFARRHHARSVWLHVRDDNEPAVRLYLSLGFTERVRRTTWRSIHADKPALLKPAGSPAANILITPRKAKHWPTQKVWLENVYPPELNWHFPLRLTAFRADLWGGLYSLLTGTSLRHWVARRNNQMLGSLTWQTFHTNSDIFWLATPPLVEDAVVHALLICARQRLSPRRPLALDYPAGQAVESIQSAGFQPQTTLIWMETALP
jgi:ribosomal protein S18 acetylase RimI-like enzyme